MTAPTSSQSGSPFRAAETSNRRLKLFLWGDSGVGKTTLALRFPSPAVVDLEGGTEHYGGAFKFEVLKATTADEVAAAVDWLLTHKHPYRTLIVDPVTLYWDALQRKWTDIFLRRNKGSKGHHGDYYDLQPRDWQVVKAEFKEFIRKLIQLDMTVVVTAREKAQYADGGFMRVVGTTFDGEKSLPYLFDTILRLYRDETGRFMAENIKDRTNKLPRGHFEVSYQLFEARIGTESLDREAEPLRLVTPEQLARLGHFIAVSGMYPSKVSERLQAYGAKRLEDLTEENANLILAKFESAAAAKVAAAMDHPVGE
ncbi:MAG TPA: ATP-binding protein [Candidatus Krumholzibacteria bacterium]|nr:ATP-binding protein [Candidatus Krumholzibacteria bacterium]HPD73314.1 ATP-binding protein [Candidatus Krumholzibacteria bacterium]HRY42030.1 ATP-binding protein [Candidatus Krumholzibacteria bacterium]